MSKFSSFQKKKKDEMNVIVNRPHIELCDDFVGKNGNNGNNNTLS